MVDAGGVEESDSDVDSDGNLRDFVVNSSDDDNDASTSESEGEFVDKSRQRDKRLRRSAHLSDSSDDDSESDDSEYDQSMVLLKLHQRRSEYKVIDLRHDPLIREYCGAIHHEVGDYLVVRKPTAICTIAHCANSKCTASDGHYGPSYEEHYVRRMHELTNCVTYPGSNFKWCLTGFNSDSEQDGPIIWTLPAKDHTLFWDKVNQIRCICDYSSSPPGGEPMKNIALIMHRKSRISFVTGSSCWHQSADASKVLEAQDIHDVALGTEKSLLFGKKNSDMVAYIFSQHSIYDDDSDDDCCATKAPRKRRRVIEDE